MLSGQDPYLVANFYYPLPFAYLFAPLALLPQWPAFWLWLVANLALLALMLRRRALPWLLFVPVLHQLSSGQVELALWAMAQALKSGWQTALLAALITLKPQAALIYLPWHLIQWWRSEKRTLLMWVVFTSAIWGLPMLWRPDWLLRWRAALPGVSVSSASNSPGLFSLLSLFPAAWLVLALAAAVVFVWGQLQSKEVARACAVLGSPLGLFYSTMPLLDCAPAWMMIAASLAAAGASLWLRSFIPFTGLSILVLVWQLRQSKKTV